MSGMRQVVCAVALAGAAGCAADKAEDGEPLGAASLELPTCVTLRRGNPGEVLDTYVSAGAPSFSGGDATMLYTGLASDGERRALMRFDLGAIPAEHGVTSATLSLYQNLKKGTSEVRVHRATQAWTEADATWGGAGSAFDPDPAASIVAASGYGTRTADLSALAQAWVNGVENHGLVLEEDPTLQTQFRSSEFTTADRRPTLTVCYVTPTCDDGLWDQGEEGVDCGGPCAPCPSCSDGIQNQGEEDVDCGAPCAACPTCSDGIQNQGETGVDCGGPCAALCPTCQDGLQSGGELGVDCGGPCPSCALCGGATVYFSEDFHDNAQGWTLGPEWGIGPAEESCCGVYAGDPGFDHSPSSDDGIAGVAIGGNASTAAPHGYHYLESPPFDTSGAPGPVVLGYYRWLNSDYEPFMNNTVEVWDGAQWVVVWESGSEFIRDSSPHGQGWTLVEHDVTPYKGAGMRVRFGFDVGESGAWSMGSWNLDDITVSSAGCAPSVPPEGLLCGNGAQDAWEDGVDCGGPCEVPCSTCDGGQGAACDGGHVWSRRGGDPDYQSGLEIAFDSAGDVFVSGEFKGTLALDGVSLVSGGGEDIFVAKLDAATGAPIWARRFGDGANQWGYGLAVDSAGDVLLTGTMQGTVDFGGGPLVGQLPDVYAVKLDGATGDHVWSKRFGDGGEQYGLAAAVDSAGDVVLTGTFFGSIDFGGGPLISVGNSDLYVAKLDGATGDHMWSQRFGGPQWQEGWGIAVDRLDDVLVVGRAWGSIDFGAGPLVSAGGSDSFVAKLDGASGTHVWSHRFGAAGYDAAYSVAPDPAGNALLTGVFSNTVDFGGGPRLSAGGMDMFVLQLDAAGTHRWSKGYGGATNDIGGTVRSDAAGNAVIGALFSGDVDLGGGVLTSAGSYDVLAAKLGPDGEHIWSRRAGATSSDSCEGVAVNAAGEVVLTGYFQESVDFGGGALLSSGAEDMFVVRLAP